MINISVHYGAERYFIYQIHSFHVKTRWMNLINIEDVETKLNNNFYI